jgi:hypothetical protein
MVSNKMVFMAGKYSHKLNQRVAGSLRVRQHYVREANYARRSLIAAKISVAIKFN